MAEFVKVSQDAKRMCNSFKNCKGCPAKLPIGDCELNFTYSDSFCKADLEKLEKEIEEWAKSHPKITNLNALKKVFPKANQTIDCCKMIFLGGVEGCDECYKKFGNFQGCRKKVEDFLNAPYEGQEENK